MNALTPMRRAVWVIEDPSGFPEEICFDREHAEHTLERYPHGWSAARYTRDAVQGDDADPGAAHEPWADAEELFI